MLFCPLTTFVEQRDCLFTLSATKLRLVSEPLRAVLSKSGKSFHRTLSQLLLVGVDIAGGIGASKVK